MTALFCCCACYGTYFSVMIPMLVALFTWSGPSSPDIARGVLGGGLQARPCCLMGPQTFLLFTLKFLPEWEEWQNEMQEVRKVAGASSAKTRPPHTGETPPRLGGPRRPVLRRSFKDLNALRAPSCNIAIQRIKLKQGRHSGTTSTSTCPPLDALSRAAHAE